jgi:RecA/RadA recombinase
MARHKVKTADASAPRAKESPLAAVASRFKAFRPAREVLKVVRAVPTRFVQFDHATRVGGLPIERFMLIHGPSSEGKTSGVLGFCDSFLSRDHFVLYIDAERTTPITWARELMGKMADHPGFYADRPDTYEATIGKVREFLNLVADLKSAGKVPKETSALVVVDSLRKLVPANLMKEILQAEEDGKKGKIKAGQDRGAQLKAKMNAAWCDELVPLLEHAGAGFLAVAREMQDPDADQNAKKYGYDYKIGGGGTIFYDASLSMRVERAAWVVDKKEEGRKPKVFGERHRITIKKTKVAGKDDKASVAYFHTSNGVHVPLGFDRARDVLELAVRFGIVRQKGSSYSTGKTRSGMLGRGEHAVVKRLAGDSEALGKLEAEVREKFGEQAPVEYDSQTGEVE